MRQGRLSMTPELHQKAKQLFLDVCELTPPAQRQHLEQHCHNNPDLRAEVESLLQYHDTRTLLPAAAAVTAPLEAPAAHPAAARWPAGTLIADRYRIVSPLGRGGMGEVYRAEDTRLSRPVALKFITAGRGTDPLWLSHFHAEAKLASTVTHRHVCRIHDVGEADGEAYLSMEYIDGENLSGLLRRVGRLTADKALELTRQMCLGLQAIHERGIVHRDLKPANIMIDGRGEARITDFGVAVSRVDSTGAGSAAGTPRYMAPELRRGGPATVQSDLYALGLILYEMVTGRYPADPVEAGTADKPPVLSPPGEWVPGLDSGFEQIIVQCLEPEPANRPRSAYEVLAALPGSGTLQALLAAGELPPLEVIARSAPRSRWNRPIANASLLLVIAGLVLVLLLADRTMLVPRAGLRQPPEVLADRARRMLETLGHPPAGRRTRGEFVIHQGRWESTRRPSADTSGVEKMPGGEILAYQLSVFAEVSNRQDDIDFLHADTDMLPVVRVVVNGEGALRELNALAPSRTAGPDHSGQPAQAMLFDLAGLDPDAYRSVPVESSGPGTGVLRWESIAPAGPVVRVELHQRHGEILRFSVSSSAGAHSGVTRDAVNQLLTAIVFLVTLGAALPLAWRNLRRRISDRRGAFRISLFTFPVKFLQYAVTTSVPATGLETMTWIIAGVRSALFLAFLVWLYYIALEPHVRRYWPHALLSWARVVTGRWRETLVGRDVLAGCACGVLMLVIRQTGTWLASGSAASCVDPIAPLADWHPGRLSGYGFTLSALAGSAVHALSRSFLALALMLMLRLLTRQRLTAVGLFVVVLAGTYVIGSKPVEPLGFVSCGLLAMAAGLILDRLGLLSFAVMLFCLRLLVGAPLTIDTGAWYADQGFLHVVIILVLAVSGYLVSRGGDHASDPVR